MRSSCGLIQLLLATCLAPALVIASSQIFVHHQHLFVDGNEFYIRGMCYNPSPLGLENATGLCSRRLTPWGEWKSACYDSDYADGSRTPPGTGPSHEFGWFGPLWERDIPAMAAAGVNTVRLYSANAVTQEASIIYNGTRSIIAAGTGKAHIPFLDYCWAHGIRVIFPLLSDCKMYMSLDNDTIEWMLRNQIDEVGNHPALLMYAVGNEWTGLCPTTWLNVTELMGNAIRYARSYQLERWHRHIPFMTSVVYNAAYFEEILRLMPVDVFGVNSYEGAQGAFTMPNLWTRMKTLLCQYGAALFLSEFNPQGWQNAGSEFPTGITTYWRDFIQNSDATGIIGAAYFEWTNEPVKHWNNQDDMGVVRLAPAIDPSTGLSTVSDKGWEIPDQAIPKEDVLNAICCGTIDGMGYNYKTDPFVLLGRAPYTIDNVPARCQVDAPGYPGPSLTTTVAVTTTQQSTSTAAAASASAATTGVTTSPSTTVSTLTTTSTLDSASASETSTTSTSSSSSSSSGPSSSSSTSLSLSSTSTISTSTAAASGASVPPSTVTPRPVNGGAVAIESGGCCYAPSALLILLLFATLVAGGRIAV